MRIVHTGTVNFLRNASLAIAAMAVMIVTLTIILFSLIANATFSNTIQSITNKIDVSVYLNDSVTQSQTTQLVNELKKLPNTESVEYLSKAEVLRQYEAQNSGNQQLQMAIDETSNPLPATIHVKPRDLNKIQDIKDFLLQFAAAMQAHDRDPHPLLIDLGKAAGHRALGGAAYIGMVGDVADEPR